MISIAIKCCKNCKDRYLGCHDKCDKYKKEKALMEAYRDSQRNTNIYSYVRAREKKMSQF